MNNFDIYKDIAMRTNGDIYIGVVGPVRTGKSTFITKMLNTLVLPNIKDKYSLERTIDEMPQSGDGKSIMTTQPKFIPNDSIKIALDNDVSMNIRAIDCVGYLIDGVSGHMENDKPRLITTPWSSSEMPFEKAAEIGTHKVISNHSTIAILVTTDGTITGIPRSSYIPAEERVVKELKECNKPFVVIVNTTSPSSTETKNLTKELHDKYGVPVRAYDVDKMSESDFNDAFSDVLYEFPVSSIGVKMPSWMQALPFESSIIQKIVNTIFDVAEKIVKVRDALDGLDLFADDPDFMPVTEKNILMGEGRIVLNIEPRPELFYKELSEQCGVELKGDYHLMSYIRQMRDAKVQYEKFREALQNVAENGYGVVQPDVSEMVLDEPKVLKQGGKYGVKFRATAPSLHIMRVDLETEVNSLIGTEEQTTEVVKSLVDQYTQNPADVWQTKIFGRNLYDMINDGMRGKLVAMPAEIQKKMRRTLGRIVNEGKGGVICILL